MLIFVFSYFNMTMPSVIFVSPRIYRVQSRLLHLASRFCVFGSRLPRFASRFCVFGLSHVLRKAYESESGSFPFTTVAVYRHRYRVCMFTPIGMFVVYTCRSRNCSLLEVFLC